MQSVIALLIKQITITTALVLFTTTSGCMYSPYGSPYGPGYGGYPGGYPAGAPIQTLQPGVQPYIPQGGTYPGGTYPGGVYPGGTIQGPIYQNGTIQPGTTFEGGSGGLQPIPNNSGATGGGSVNVPDPYYPNPNSSSSLQPINSGIQPANHTESAPTYQFPSGVNEVQAQPPQSAQTRTFTASPTQPFAQPNSASEAPQFQPPINSNPIPPAQPAQPVGGFDFDIPAAAPSAGEAGNPFGSPAPAQNESAAAMPLLKVNPQDLNPFMHDADFKMLRGVVSRDPADGTWGIIYDDNPTPDDQLAGHITLAKSPHLADFKDGDIVELQGEVDTIARDALGKPVYLIRNATKLVEGPAQ